MRRVLFHAAQALGLTMIGLCVAAGFILAAMEWVADAVYEALGGEL